MEDVVSRSRCEEERLIVVLPHNERPMRQYRIGSRGGGLGTAIACSGDHDHVVQAMPMKPMNFRLRSCSWTIKGRSCNNNPSPSTVVWMTDITGDG